MQVSVVLECPLGRSSAWWTSIAVSPSARRGAGRASSARRTRTARTRTSPFAIPTRGVAWNAFLTATASIRSDQGAFSSVRCVRNVARTPIAPPTSVAIWQKRSASKHRSLRTPATCRHSPHAPTGVAVASRRPCRPPITTYPTPARSRAVNAETAGRAGAHSYRRRGARLRD